MVDHTRGWVGSCPPIYVADNTDARVAYELIGMPSTFVEGYITSGDGLILVPPVSSELSRNALGRAFSDKLNETFVGET